MITVIMVLFPMIKAITTLVLTIWNEKKNIKILQVVKLCSEAGFFLEHNFAPL